jgi:zinc transport system ATP-binding protein
MTSLSLQVLPHTHVQAGSDLGKHKGQDVVCVHNVSFSYDGRAALKNITLHVKQGTTLGIIGPNGGGKSTLMKLMLGSLKPDAGTISVLGLSPADACSKGNLVGYVPQRHMLNWSFPITVRQVVQLGLFGKKGLFGTYKHEDRQRVEETLQAVNMQHMANQPIGGLSGGQQQRVFIARALVATPKLLFLDEPTTGIDQAAQESFASLLETIKRQYGLTLIMVSHNLRSVIATCDHVACLNQTLHYHDQPHGLSRDVLFKVFQCDMDAVLDTHLPTDTCCAPATK